MRLDYKQQFPSGMDEYLSFYGWHFSKKMCDWAVSKMYRVINGKKQKVDVITKERLNELMNIYNVKFECPYEYDCLYVINMAKADFYGTTMQDERSLLSFTKDYTEDSDGYDGLPFTRFYADCIGSGIGIPWEDVI